MIQIERLKTKLRRPFLSLCDILHNNRNNLLKISFDSSPLIPHIKSKTPQVSIGAQYGYEGIDILLLTATKPNLVIETHYADLLLLTSKQQKWLLENYTVILCDFEEGGDVYNVSAKTEGTYPCLIEHLKKLNIMPKKIFSLSPGVLQNNYPKLNIESIYICIWPIITICNNPFYLKFTFDRNSKEAALKKLDLPRESFGLCLNKKPRYDRVKMLAELDARNLLEKFDWSLMYSNIPLGSQVGHFVKSPSNFKFNKILENSDDKQIKTFLNKYPFPKLMQDINNEQYNDAFAVSPNWLGKYCYYLSNETFSEFYTSSLGYSSVISEKTFKAMCIGAYPFVLGLPNFESKLKELGFKLHSYDYDNLYGEERIQSIADIIESVINSPFEHKSLTIQNFDLITDVQFLAGLVASPINQMFQPS
jgi:hypothetical protein